MRGWVLGAILAILGCGSAHQPPATAPTRAQPETTTPTTTAPTAPTTAATSAAPADPVSTGADDPIDDADVLPLDGKVAPRPRSREEQPMNDPFGPPPGEKPTLAPKGRLGNDPPPKKLDCRKKPELCGAIHKL